MTAPIPTRVSLDSTSLAAVVYDGRRGELELDFRDGTRYAYSGVAPELFQDLLSATSKGFFFNRFIRGRFPYAKLPAEN
jgi:KTSC domain-containing protein